MSETPLKLPTLPPQYFWRIKCDWDGLIRVSIRKKGKLWSRGVHTVWAIPRRDADANKAHVEKRAKDAYHDHFIGDGIKQLVGDYGA